jgi:hypothetical protein
MAMLSTVAVTTALSAAIAAPPTYNATILPQLDDTDSEFKLTYTSPFAMNDLHEIVGDLGNFMGFHWSPTEGGEWLQPMFASVADTATGTCINNAGEIGGRYQPAGSFGSRPFHLADDGTFTPLPTLGASLSAGVADINDSGMLVGSGEISSGGTFGGPQSSLYWINGALHEIGGFGGPVSTAAAVNNNGVVVGYSNSPTVQAIQPYIWTKAEGLQPLPQFEDGVPASPADINDNGLIVGRGGVSLFQNVAVYWDADTHEVHQLPSVSNEPIDIGVYAVNDEGIMVGFELENEFEARLWMDNNVYHLQDLVVDLPSGYDLARAVDISEDGAIAVEARITVKGQIQFVTVLLTPEEAEVCLGDVVSSATFQPPPDGQVDGADLAYLLGEWGRNLGSAADIVTSATFQPPPDGVVDAADLAVLLGAWGVCE